MCREQQAVVRLRRYSGQESLMHCHEDVTQHERDQCLTQYHSVITKQDSCLLWDTAVVSPGMTSVSLCHKAGQWNQMGSSCHDKCLTQYHYALSRRQSSPAGHNYDVSKHAMCSTQNHYAPNRVFFSQWDTVLMSLRMASVLRCITMTSGMASVTQYHSVITEQDSCSL